MIAHAPRNPSKLRTPSGSLAKISNRLSALQAKLFAEYGISSIYIGAGSSLAVLDHCLEGKDLVMRDLDIFACLGKQMTRSIAHAMGRRLETPEIGRFSAHDVRPRRRGNPGLPLPQAYDYNAGFGFFMINEDETILDLTVFHSDDDMLLNGIMNVDKVRIRLEFGTSLLDQFAPLFDSESPDFGDLGIEDFHGGYRSWQAGTAELANEFDVRRAPLQTILRIIRTFAKFSVPSISEMTRDQLERLMAESEDNSVAFHTIRGLIKMLNDRNAIWELRLLRDLGGLRKIGGVARRQLEELFQVLERFDFASDVAEVLIKATARQLAEIEHQMKLEGVI